MEIRKFWPLDFDPEGEIYENVAWDLPGYHGRLPKVSRSPKRVPKPAANCQIRHTTL